MVAIFSSDDDAIISENCIAIAGDSLSMHNINTLTPDHRRGLQQLTSQRTYRFHRSYRNEVIGIQFLLWSQMVGSALMKIKINPKADKNLNGF